MTEADIINTLSRNTDERRFPWQLANSFVYQWECDFWTMTASGETREFEIKISRGDFFCDAKKEKHSRTDGANYFYYVVPDGLVKKEEVDKRYGLIYVRESSIRNTIELIRKPTRLHDHEFSNWKILANKMYWKFRDLWREKWIKKEITRDEYFEGFNIRLLEHDVSP